MMQHLDWRPRRAVAVLGGSLRYSERQIEAGFCVGRQLALNGKIVVTGATNGVPYAAALGAHSVGGFVVGVSPAGSARDHVESGRPRLQADFLVYTAMEAEGRSPLILRSVAAAIFIGGELGTLGEFCAGWTSGCPVLGVLEEHGGLSDSIRGIVDQVSSSWGSEAIFDSDAVRLAANISERADLTSDDMKDPQSLGEEVRSLLERRKLFLRTVDQ